MTEAPKNTLSPLQALRELADLFTGLEGRVEEDSELSLRLTNLSTERLNRLYAASMLVSLTGKEFVGIFYEEMLRREISPPRVELKEAE